MAAVGDIMKLGQKIQQDATGWYNSNRVPAAFRAAHPLVLARAALESGGDWQRCLIDDDLSITVFNRAVWTPEA